MSLIASSVTAAKALNCFASVELIGSEDAHVITKTLRVWKKFISNYVSSHLEKGLLDERSKLITSDYITVIGLLQNTIFHMRTRSHIKLFAAKDLKEEIQSISCCTLTPKAPPSRLISMHISELITAPWNLRLTVLPHPEPLYGGGVFLMHAMFHFAKTNTVVEIKLNSTPTSIPFYKKLGMKFDGINRFSFDPLSKEHEDALNSRFSKIPTSHVITFSSKG